VTVSIEYPVISELVVVEGLHDKQAVDAAVKADIWIIGGDRIASRFLQELERAAKLRGVIILTDPDGPGERIRRRIEERIPNCKHAFLQKSEALGEGRVGVEFASPESIRAALLSVRDPQNISIQEQVFTLLDLRNTGLAGGVGAAEKRAKVGERLRIGYANAKAFVRKLNVLRITRDEWNEALSGISTGKGTRNDN
jgi:ribonuclease M5